MPKWTRAIRTWLSGRSVTSSSTRMAPLSSDIAPCAGLWIEERVPVFSFPFEDKDYVALPPETTTKELLVERQNQGAQFAANHLALLRAAFPSAESAMYAQGLICAARDVMFDVLGPEKAFEQLSIIADDTLKPILPKDQ